MTKRRKILVWVLGLLYGLTWVGGWMSHTRQLQDDTQAAYYRIERQNQELVALAHKVGDTDFRPIELNAKPTSEVNWCVPIFPGILLADSEHCIGPLVASGGVKVVLYYGLGSIELFMLWGWIT